MAEFVFQSGAENPEIHHIAEQVQKTAVHEERKNNAQKRRYRLPYLVVHYSCGNSAIPEEDKLAFMGEKHQINKGTDINRNNDERNYRDTFHRIVFFLEE